MEREKVIELAYQAGFRTLEDGQGATPWHRFARPVEQETLERAAAKLDEEAKRGGYGTWDNMRPSTFIRNLKDNHNKE